MSAMKVYCASLILCAMLGFSAATQAANNTIAGAFGIWFGEMLDSEEQELVFEGKDGERAYAVNTPPRAYDALNRYTVFVTDDDRVFEIVGDGRLESQDACIEELIHMTEVVAAKYPGAARLASEGTLIRRTMLRQGEHLVEIVCVDEYLAIRYRDDGILRQAADSGSRDSDQVPSAKLSERDTAGL